MAEQANTQKRTRKPSPGAAAPAIQNIMAVVVPVEIFDQMKRAVRKQPVEDVELLLQAMKNLMPQQVTMTMETGLPIQGNGQG